MELTEPQKAQLDLFQKPEHHKSVPRLKFKELRVLQFVTETFLETHLKSHSAKEGPIGLQDVFLTDN